MKKNAKIDSLTLDEKIYLLSGHNSWHSKEFKDKGIRALYITDGPTGVRKLKEKCGDSILGEYEEATCFPSASTLACSWNKNLLNKVGTSLGEECVALGVDVLLGPGMNIQRNPLCGRNFEYYSEDPYLTGILTSYLVKGVQSNHVASCVKHFACNNKEDFRFSSSSYVDERTLHEIYLKGFEICIKKAKPQALMTSYNQVNGVYASENEHLLKYTLRNNWDYQGVCMSDWGGISSRINALKCSLDLEMPGDCEYHYHLIKDHVTSHPEDLHLIDESASRILSLHDFCSQSVKAPCLYEKHDALAKTCALEGAVLLKNENHILPLERNKKYLIVGDYFTSMHYQGSGSAFINAYKVVQPIESFNKKGINFKYIKGYDSKNLDDVSLAASLTKEATRNLDYAIFFGGTPLDEDAEARDKSSLLLPKGQLAALEKLIQLKKKIILVLFTGSVIQLDCYDDLAGILNMNLPGQAGGDACYDLLFGIVSPSGRLAQTWMKKYQDIPFHEEFKNGLDLAYKEGLFVGYRYYDTFKKEVRFPFGFGLSYGEVTYDSLDVNLNDDNINIKVKIKNTSSLPLKEVVQVYIAAPRSKIIKPIHELRGFEKVNLKPNEEKVVSIIIPKNDLSYYNTRFGWTLESGNYLIQIGKSSQDILLEQEIYIQGGNNLYLYKEEVNRLFENDQTFLKMNKKEFEMVCHHFIPNRITYPYTMATPLVELDSFFGRRIYAMIKKRFVKALKKAHKIKDDNLRYIEEKNAIFQLEMMKSINLNMICFSSQGQVSYHQALGLLYLANGKIGLGIKNLLTHEKKFLK